MSVQGLYTVFRGVAYVVIAAIGGAAVYALATILRYYAQIAV